MLDEVVVQAAPELMAVTAEVLNKQGVVDTDVVHTVAAYHWARSLAQADAALSTADHEEAMRVFGLLYLADPRRVPPEFWSELTL